MKFNRLDKEKSTRLRGFYSDGVFIRFLLIAPLVEELSDLIDTSRVNAGFAGHLLLRVLTNLFVIH